MIKKGYLEIEYTGRLPMLVFSKIDWGKLRGKPMRGSYYKRLNDFWKEKTTALFRS